MSVTYTVVQRMGGARTVRLPSLNYALKVAATDQDKGDHPYQIISGGQVFTSQQIVVLLKKAGLFRN